MINSRVTFKRLGRILEYYQSVWLLTGKERDDENGYLVIRPFGLPGELVMVTPNYAVLTLKKL